MSPCSYRGDPVSAGDLCICVLSPAVVYISTEGAFPSRRLEQMRTARGLTAAATDRILIEHVPSVVSVTGPVGPVSYPVSTPLAGL